MIQFEIDVFLSALLIFFLDLSTSKCNSDVLNLLAVFMKSRVSKEK